MSTSPLRPAIVAAVAFTALAFVTRAHAFSADPYFPGGSQYSGDTQPSVSMDYSTGHLSVSISISIDHRQGEGFYSTGCSVSFYRNGSWFADIPISTDNGLSNPNSQYTNVYELISGSFSVTDSTPNPGDRWSCGLSLRGTQHGTTWSASQTFSSYATVPSRITPTLAFAGRTAYNSGDTITGTIGGATDPTKVSWSIAGLTSGTGTSVIAGAKLTNGSDSQTFTLSFSQTQYGWYNGAAGSVALAVGKRSFAAPVSANSSATVGTAWAPTISGGGPTQGTAFAVSGITHWSTSGWTPSSSDADQTYAFYVANLEDATQYMGTPCVDPGFEGTVLAISGPYYVAVTALPQKPNGPVTITPASAAVTKGASVSFIAAGGQNGYAWVNAASTGATTASATFGSAGTYFVSVTSPAGNGYAASNTATATVTVTDPGLSPQTVSIWPNSATVATGDSVTFFANGGHNGYSWGGVAAGSGGSKQVTFSTSGTYNVTVFSPAGGGYDNSNTATATITVSVSSPPNNATVIISGDQGTHQIGGAPPGH